MLSIFSPSEVISKSLIPKSMPIAVPVDFIGKCSVSTNIDTKYLPDGTCEIVADFIFPINSLWILALIHLSLGN